MLIFLRTVEQAALMFSGLAVLGLSLLLRREARFDLERLGAFFFSLAGIFLILWRVIVQIPDLPIQTLLNNLSEATFAITTALAILLYISTLLNLHTKGIVIHQSRALEKAEREAITDGLTGLYNHRGFQKRLADEIERSRRYGRPLSLLILDLDHFKKLNDTFGHPAGDAVLRDVGLLIKQALRIMDLPARYGGEEFAVILPETPIQGARQVADRIRERVKNHPYPLGTDSNPTVSVSIGSACFPSDAIDRAGLIDAADKALYYSKENGRNRVTLYSEMLETDFEKNLPGLDEAIREPSLKVFRDVGVAIDSRNTYTIGHTDQVIRLAMQFAGSIGLRSDDRESLQIASLLHNIGMLSVPEHVLNKPGPLTLEEKKIIQAHPMLAEMLLKDAARSNGVLPAILYHHERWDGKGYPRGLRGSEIPYLARVLGICESFHAMVSMRPYRKKLSEAGALEELKENGGRQFDPDLVEAFASMFQMARSGGRVDSG